MISYDLCCFLINHSPSLKAFLTTLRAWCACFFVCCCDCSPACVFAWLLVRLFVWLRVCLVGCLPVCGFVAYVLASSVLRCFVSSSHDWWLTSLITHDDLRIHVLICWADSWGRADKQVLATATLHWVIMKQLHQWVEHFSHANRWIYISIIIYIYTYRWQVAKPFPIGNATLNGRLSITKLDCQRVIYMVDCSQTGRQDTSSSPQVLDKQHRS